MRCNWRRWLWGLIPIAGISVAAVHLERGAIEKDLTERAERALTRNGERWAVVNFSGRDVVLAGNATSENEPPEAEAILRRLWGVRQVNNNANLPPMVEPYQWAARRRGNRVRLSGFVPDRATRQTIIGMTNAALPGLEIVDRMRAGRGVPPADTWLAGVSFALKQLSSLKQGEVRLDGLALTLSGEAENATDYRTVSAALKRGLPKGIALAGAQVAAPVVSPYTWSAQFAGGQIVLSGHVAGDAAKADMQAAAATAAAGTDVVDRMETAAGAPADFAAAAAALIRQIVRLQSGTAEIRDTSASIGGVAADDAQAQAVRDSLHGALPSSYKLTDQIRVREAPRPEPKVEPKPPIPSEPSPPAGQQHADARDALPHAVPADPQPKVAAAAPVSADTRPAPAASPASPLPAAPPPAAPAPAPPVSKEPTAPATLAVPAPPVVPIPSVESQLAACRDDLARLAGANPVTFERSSAELEPAGRDLLSRIAAAVKSCPGVRIAAEGHADVEGIPDYNQRLSVKRALAVADYLIAAGVGADQIETAGFGATRPVAPNSTPEARARNRRTEIVVRGK